MTYCSFKCFSYSEKGSPPQAAQVPAVLALLRGSPRRCAGVWLVEAKPRLQQQELHQHETLKSEKTVKGVIGYLCVLLSWLAC